MREKHGAAVEKVGMGLVCSVETFRGSNIQLVKRTSGFNGLSTNRNGEVRKIEVKSMERSDYWIAINGITAIDKLFFERDYWLYFVLMPENIVVMTKGLPFIRQQLSLSKNVEFLDNLEAWMKSTRHLSRSSGLKFIPRMNIKFTVPVRKLVALLTQNTNNETWSGSIIEIWQNKATWERIYLAKEVD